MQKLILFLVSIVAVKSAAVGVSKAAEKAAVVGVLKVAVKVVGAPKSPPPKETQNLVIIWARQDSEHKSISVVGCAIAGRVIATLAANVFHLKGSESEEENELIKHQYIEVLAGDRTFEVTDIRNCGVQNSTDLGVALIILRFAEFTRPLSLPLVDNLGRMTAYRINKYRIVFEHWNDIIEKGHNIQYAGAPLVSNGVLFGFVEAKPPTKVGESPSEIEATLGIIFVNTKEIVEKLNNLNIPLPGTEEKKVAQQKCNV